MVPPAATRLSTERRTYGPIVAALEEIFDQLPLSDYPALVGELERLKFIAVGRMMAQPSDTNNSQDPDLLTIPEVAKRLRISEYRAYELTRQGIIQSLRLGRSVRVRPSAVAEYLSRRCP
jgi:excisionase family DNA binding protein